MWAEKEMHNLMKMGKFGIPVPEVILLRKHVLVFLEARSFCQLAVLSTNESLPLGVPEPVY